MRVLGLNCYLHDSAAALVEDGVVVAAVREERFTGEPHDSTFPVQAISWCLGQAQVELGDLDGVAYYWRPWLGLTRRARILASGLPKSLQILVPSGTTRGTPGVVVKHLLVPFALRGRFGQSTKFAFVPHHRAHLAAAFYTSPFDTAALVSMDLSGEIASTVTAKGHGEELSVTNEILYPHSLGSFYAALTQYLGFRPIWDEYKVMGLAAFGDERFYERLRALVTLLPNGGFALDLEAFVHHRGGEDFFSPSLEVLLGPRRQPLTPPTAPQYAAVAWAAQMVLEDVAGHVISHAVSAAGTRDLCLTGGVALNSVMIGRLRNELQLSRVFVPPAPDDAGASAGAALAMWRNLARSFEIRAPVPRSTASLSRLGPASSQREVRRSVARYPHLQVSEYDDWVRQVAAALASGEVVAWHQGPCEFGPRALGGRSLLADPRDPLVANRIRSAIKRRESFRPFAASVLEERATEYFDLPAPVPYMTEVRKVRAAKRRLLPAITHVDGTCRPHTVARPVDPLFWSLLAAFGRLTGHPVLLNTSFNRDGQAMVCTAEQAVSTFLRMPIRLLAIEGLIVTKRTNVETKRHHG